jgi:transposase
MARNSDAKLSLSDDDTVQLTRVASSRTETAGRVMRAKILLGVGSGERTGAISSRLSIDPTTVRYTRDKAIEFGPLTALDDLSRPGRPTYITAEAKTWIISLACQKPVAVGHPHELWSLRLLCKHVRHHCRDAGHDCLLKVVPSTIRTVLSDGEIHPHKISYYLERRDPDFETKMAEVLHVYREVSVWQTEGPPEGVSAVISYDEKPGIQAIGNAAPDLPPVPGRHPHVGRDHEYVRHGTLSLLAGIDLVTGTVHGILRDTHRSAEFIEFLGLIDATYATDAKIRVVLDNHSAHTSAEVRAYLATRPNRFEFVFTPKHGSWLNIIEIFFAKMANTVLRGIRAGSKADLAARIEHYLQEINQDPVPIRWTYGINQISMPQSMGTN